MKMRQSLARLAQHKFTADENCEGWLIGKLPVFHCKTKKESVGVAAAILNRRGITIEQFEEFLAGREERLENLTKNVEVMMRPHIEALGYSELDKARRNFMIQEFWLDLYFWAARIWSEKDWQWARRPAYANDLDEIQ